MIVFAGVIELRVRDAGAGGHALQFARLDHRAGAEAVLVLKRAFQHPRQDFHVAMAVRPKAAPGFHPILVDNAQRAVTHEAVVVVIAERERVAALQPAEVGVSAFARTSNPDHWPFIFPR
jgi:hypothetical protein